jgi:hypothetical protein
MIGRREVITLLGGATAWPLRAHAQQPAMPVVGFLSIPRSLSGLIPQGLERGRLCRGLQRCHRV